MHLRVAAKKMTRTTTAYWKGLRGPTDAVTRLVVGIGDFAALLTGGFYWGH